MTLIQVTQEERCVQIALNRPEKRNALSPELSEQLSAALHATERTPLPVVIRSATPGMFMSGTDVNELRQRRTGESLTRRNAGLFEQIECHPYPTIAVVAGEALGGGCELALACDFRISTNSAKWGLPEVTLGIIPSAGALTRLERLVTRGVALELILTGQRITGDDAQALGLVQRAVSETELNEEVTDLLMRLARGSALAQRLAKEAMRVTGDARRLIDAVAQQLCINDEETQRRLRELIEKSAR